MYSFTSRLYPSQLDNQGRLRRRILAGYQKCGSTSDFFSILMWHGCCADNICNDCRVSCSSQAAHVAWPSGPVCGEVAGFISPVKLGQWGQYGQPGPISVIQSADS